MAKQFLDSAGLTALWDRIKAGFAPTWKAIDINEVSLTTTADKLVLGLKTTGPNPAGTDTNPVSGTLDIPAVTTSKAGVMTASDKAKLDNLGSSINGAIKFDGLQVNSKALTLTNKIANFNLEYDSASDSLIIRDLNKVSDNILTSVSVNSFIGDALLSGTLTSASIVDKDGNNNAGTFLKLVFSVTKNDGSTDTDTIYANVADLVSTYTAGTGISITTANTGVDNTATSATISLKQAATNAIGGIKVSKVFTTDPTIQTATTYASRYFPIETTKSGQAIVNIPSSGISIGSTTAGNGGTLSHGGTFTVMTGLTEVESTTDGSTTITPTLTTYKLPAVPDITVTANTATTSSPTHGGTFTVVSAIAKDGHGLKYTPTTVTLPAETTLTVTGTATDSITLKPGEVNEVQVLETITGSNHTITRDFKTIKVADPESIPVATINALAYPS